MGERPGSSVTTILEYFVGRSVVSAMTHTPASGPLGPVTVPAISLPPALPSEPIWAAQAASSAASAAAAMLKYHFFIGSPLNANGSPGGRRETRHSSPVTRHRRSVSARADLVSSGTGSPSASPPCRL